MHLADLCQPTESIPPLSKNFACPETLKPPPWSSCGLWWQHCLLCALFQPVCLGMEPPQHPELLLLFLIDGFSSGLLDVHEHWDPTHRLETTRAEAHLWKGISFTPTFLLESAVTVPSHRKDDIHFHQRMTMTKASSRLSGHLPFSF